MPGQIKVDETKSLKATLRHITQAQTWVILTKGLTPSSSAGPIIPGFAAKTFETRRYLWL
jgi:hypothetical protein